MVFLNTTSDMGSIIYANVLNISGSEFITIFIIFLLLLGCFYLFKVPIEWSLVFLLPMLIVIGAYNSIFLTILGLILFIISIIIVRNWWIT